MKKKIVVTGGSGFIGTNLIEYFLEKGFEVLNIDYKEPKIVERKLIWKNVDITNYKLLRDTIIEYNPRYIVHLAARTDLDGKKLKDYTANTVGVENMMKIVSELPNLKKIIIASSKFVTTNGYKIKHQKDYCPHTVYGESKVITEEMVWMSQPGCDWCIVRPTSIWGPWFGTPYRDFFDIVKKRMYFHIGSTKCYKTYGYIGNTVYQIEQLLFNQTKDEDNKVFYLGDEPAYEINEWADEIAKELRFKVPMAPIWFVKALAKFGDLLGTFGIHFPMQSFRYGNMTSDGINEMSNTLVLAPEKRCTRKDGTKITLDWMKIYEKQ